MGRASGTIVYYAGKLADGEYGPTAYRCGDTYEYNVGLWTGWTWSFDCLGFVHTIVNGFIGDKSVLGGGAVMDEFVLDSNEAETLYDYCSVIGQFPVAELKPSTLLEMHQSAGHVGLYVGDLGHVNTIECSGGGVQWSWTDLSNGCCYNEKGGYFRQQWENWGEFDRVDYGTQPQPTPQPTPEPTEKPTYRVYDDVSKVWLSEVYGDSDFAGIYGHDVSGIAIKGVKYAVHCWKGDGVDENYEFSDWLDWVDGYNIDDYENGFAGNYHPIDALIIDSDKEIMYQIHYRNGDWEVPVSGLCANKNDSENGYAGTIGMSIDAVRIWCK